MTGKRVCSLSFYPLKTLLNYRDVDSIFSHFLTRHNDEVLKNCILLGERIIELGGVDNANFGRELITRGYGHDNSKLVGIEWEYLHKGEDLLHLAHQQHVNTNDHHPEYWLNRGMELIDMPPICIAEMVCDWKSRSSESGTDLRDFVENVAPDRWNFSKQGKFYKRIKYFLGLLLDEPLTRINTE